MGDAVYAGGLQASPVVAHALDDEPGRRTGAVFRAVG